MRDFEILEDDTLLMGRGGERLAIRRNDNHSENYDILLRLSWLEATVGAFLFEEELMNLQKYLQEMVALQRQECEFFSLESNLSLKLTLHVTGQVNVLGSLLNSLYTTSEVHFDFDTDIPLLSLFSNSLARLITPR